jgi:hypothetical protein
LYCMEKWAIRRVFIFGQFESESSFRQKKIYHRLMI